MNIHIICPFYRDHLAETLVYYLEPMGIEWYPIQGHGSKTVFNKSWIHPVFTQELTPGEQCYRKINDFLDTQPIIDADYYGFMTDDDMYEPGFFDVIRKQTAKILFYSAYGGNTIPKDGGEMHPTGAHIISSLKDVRVCNIGMSSVILKGCIFKQTRFLTNHKWDDGRYMVSLSIQFTKEIEFLPDLFVFGSYFQPGRYTNTKKFLKPTWTLPKIIKTET